MNSINTVMAMITCAFVIATIRAVCVLVCRVQGFGLVGVPG